MAKKAKSAAPTAKTDVKIQDVKMPQILAAGTRTKKRCKTRGDAVAFKVRATQAGYYKGLVRYEGEEFLYSATLKEDNKLPTWMEAVDEKNAVKYNREAPEEEEGSLDDLIS